MDHDDALRERASCAAVIPWSYYSMKTAISLPDELFKSANVLAQRMGVSRSQLFATAVAEFVAKHQSRKVTERLDRVYGAEQDNLDPALRLAQSKSLGDDTW